VVVVSVVSFRYSITIVVPLVEEVGIFMRDSQEREKKNKKLVGSSGSQRYVYQKKKKELNIPP
jgi:hypothetical protein